MPDVPSAPSCPRKYVGDARTLILATFFPGLRAAVYTTLFRWIQRLNPSLNVTHEILTEDVIIDVETNQILGLEVTDESMQDNRMFTTFLAQTPAPLRRGAPGTPGAWRWSLRPPRALQRPQTTEGSRRDQGPSGCSNPLNRVTLSCRVCQGPDPIEGYRI